MGDFEIWIGVSVVFGIMCAGVFTWLSYDGHGRLWRRFLLSFICYMLVGLCIAGGLALIFAE